MCLDRIIRLTKISSRFAEMAKDLKMEHSGVCQIIRWFWIGLSDGIFSLEKWPRTYEVKSQEHVGLSNGAWLGLSDHSDNPTPLISDYPIYSTTTAIFLGGL